MTSTPSPKAASQEAPGHNKASIHAVDLEQCALFVDSAPIKKAVTDAAVFLRALAAVPASGSEDGGAGGDAITARYTNWRGETAERTFIPHRVFFGSNEWHPEPQVLIEATDCEKGALRTFAAAGFALAKPASEPADGVREAFEQGRRDMLNHILALNPAIAAKIAHWEEREPDPHGRLPFNVVLWVTEVAAQLGIEPKEDALSAPASSSPAEEKL